MRRSEDTQGPSAETSLDELLPLSESEPLESENSNKSNGSDSKSDATMSLSGSTRSSFSTSIPMPKSIGRYRVTDLLGEGAYGQVYRAIDDQLQRTVAIKVPHADRFSSSQVLAKYLEEARTLAKLDHANIVAVHDVGVTPDGVPFIVSAYIDGITLGEKLRTDPMSVRLALQLLIQVGGALAYVHSKGIVHRDVKPGNILLNQSGDGFLADFGLALRDEVAQTERSRVGTPAYMSPEQARGESHLVDGRSDVFSLGVVLYEMLTGKRPFKGSDYKSLVYNLLHQEAKPPRQLNRKVPRDLERICLKALSKRAPERYSTATDMVEDIQHVLGDVDDSSVGLHAPSADSQSITGDSAETQLSTSTNAKVIPRGLRSYGAHDAEFFASLLPGPHDREGVPESLRFWQRQVNCTEDPPRVSVLYGPSGCGKSSFVKAGLLPLFDDSVVTVFVESTRDATEARLLRGLIKRFPSLRSASTLKEALTLIRCRPEVLGVARESSGFGESDSGAPDGHRRLVLVIDQFEQWLHGRDEHEHEELTNALRQCDGQVIQCLLLVRDDFWLALSRFMQHLEVPLRQNQNATLVDLFTINHARHVLVEFGVAYGRLPQETRHYSNEQSAFLDRASMELSEGGKVFPVRLALFVEMVKSRPWESATIAHLGGVDGIGLHFLEEAFSSELAPAAQRVHEAAARNVLRKLLPEAGVNIKGNMQPEHVLLDASGYADQPAQFDEIIRILDNDLRLVTPTDPSGSTFADDSLSASGDGVCYYQLTHDFLVPAVEQWLTRRQRETRRGRAELRLAEYGSLWASKPSRKSAPSWFDWLAIRVLSSPERWNATEREMMKSAGRRHLAVTVGVVLTVTMILVTSWMVRGRSLAVAAVQQLQTTRTQDLPQVLSRLEEQGAFPVAPLRRALSAAPVGSRKELINRLGLLPHDPSQIQPLVDHSLKLDLPTLVLLRERLYPLNHASRKTLLAALEDSQNDRSERLRAAIMLGTPGFAREQAVASAPTEVWAKHSEMLSQAMLFHARLSPQDSSSLIDGLLPIAQHLVPSLRHVAMQEHDLLRRSLATSYTVRFLSGRPKQLLDFFLEVSFEQQDVILAALDEVLEKLVEDVQRIAFAELDTQLPEQTFDRQARRKGVAAALLHRLGHGDGTWPLLRHAPWPHTRSFLVHRIAAFGGNFEVVLQRYPRESQVSIRQALWFVLGEFDWDAISEPLQMQAVLLAKDAFENDPDVGIHSAAEWALLRWGEGTWIREENDRQAKLPPDPRKNWYVNGEGYTMAVLDARDVPGIRRIFEISTKEATVEQYFRFEPDHRHFEHRSPTPDSPVGMMNWLDAARYCRWLNGKLQSEQEFGYPEAIQNNLNDSFAEVLQHGAYRLPTEAEWQYACRALTTSYFYFGMSAEIANDYVWHYDSSLNEAGNVRYYPAGMKKPNGFGLFSLYDGVREWGHDRLGERRVVLGATSGHEINDKHRFAHMQASDLPRATNGFYGLRIARTVK